MRRRIWRTASWTGERLVVWTDLSGRVVRILCIVLPRSADWLVGPGPDRFGRTWTDLSHHVVYIVFMVLLTRAHGLIAGAARPGPRRSCPHAQQPSQTYTCARTHRDAAALRVTRTTLRSSLAPAPLFPSGLRPVPALFAHPVPPCLTPGLPGRARGQV